MARILRNLKIEEVASVDRGAGSGCRITLFKRNGDTVVPDDDDVADNGTGAGADDEAYAAAVHYLFHTAAGTALLDRIFPRGAGSLADIEALARLVAGVHRDDTPSDPHQPWLDVIDEETTEKKKVHMDREEFLKAAVRREGGVSGLCRLICKRGAQGIGESELTALITEAACAQYPDLSAEQAFTKAYVSAAGEVLRRAIQITKGMLQADPAQVGGADVDDDDASKAYEQLVKIAEAERRRTPHLKMTSAQAFADAARQNPALARRAIGR